MFTSLLTYAIRDENEVLFETPTSLETDDQGAVIGVTGQSNGELVGIQADRVVLATGGFQGSEDLVEQYITDHPENLWLRSNPWSTGDGLTEVRDCGAKTTIGMGTFYGHSLPAPPATFTPSEFGDVTQHCGPFGIAIDKAGEQRPLVPPGSGADSWDGRGPRRLTDQLGTAVAVPIDGSQGSPARAARPTIVTRRRL